MTFSSIESAVNLVRGAEVDGSGILFIRRRESSGDIRRRSYIVGFLTFRHGDASSVQYRSVGDATLLRLLQEALPDAQARLHALEQVNDVGQTWVSNVPLSEGVMQKFGFGPDDWRASSLGQEALAAEACVACGQPIVSLQRTVTSDGNVVHNECRVVTSEVTEDIAAFLADFERCRFCHGCLAVLFAISYDEARKAVGRLRVGPHFRVDSGECSVCGKPRVTLWLARG